MSRSAIEVLTRLARKGQRRARLTCALCGATSLRRYVWIIRGEAYCRRHWFDAREVRTS